MNIVELNGKENVSKINFFVSYFQHLSTIPDDSEKWIALETMMKYAFYGIEPNLSKLPPQALGFFFAVKPTLDKGLIDSINGKAGGKKNKKSLSETPLEKNIRGVKKNINPPSDFSESGIGEGIGIGIGIGEGEGIGEGIKNNESDSNESDVSAEPTVTDRYRVPYQEILDAYHSTCVSLPRVRAVSDARRKLMRTRFHEHGLDEIKIVFDKAEASDFLTGRKEPYWNGCGFDWLLKPSNFLKVLEGNYDNRYQSKNPFLDMLSSGEFDDDPGGDNS